MEMGTRFNIMCVGEPSCGKSTLIESIFDIREDYTAKTTDNGNFKIVEFLATKDNASITLTVAYTKSFNTTFDHNKE